MPNHLIPATLVAGAAAAPSPTTVSNVKSLHETIRDVLGNDYETFLQGSYKNDTALPDINDVDIVAVRKQTISTTFTPDVRPTNPIPWETIFEEVQERLEASRHYRGKTERGDKCITVNTNFHADVVPAVQIGTNIHAYLNDPISIYSFREQRERKNFPRIHYQHNVSKHDRTGGNYKPTARLLKRWARAWFPDSKGAPSFYLECLVHAAPDNLFVNDLATSLFGVLLWIAKHVDYAHGILSVAGDKNILASNEWPELPFATFRLTVANSLFHLSQALKATSETAAVAHWKKAFHE